MNKKLDFIAKPIHVDESKLKGIDFIAQPPQLRDAKDTLREEFLNKRTVNALEHFLFIRDTDKDLVYEVYDSIKTINEDIKVDGMPIGKFPIGILEFSVSGDWTQKVDPLGNYEVSGYDEYHFDSGDSIKFKMKTYIITDIEYRHEERTTYFKGYDYGSKLSVKYDDKKYKLPMTFGQFVERFYKEHGLEVANIDDLFMKDYQLSVIPAYETDMLSLQVARDIAKFSLSLQFVNENNQVVIKNVEDLGVQNTKDLPKVVHFKTFRERPNNFKTLGINTLTLGLQSDIDSENVSKSDKTMVSKDGVVELRLDEIPFVYNESLKREVIDRMFEKVKGFKYYAFESETTAFIVGFGERFIQVEQGNNGESYPVTALEYNVTKQGSMMTRHSAESKSERETQMRWEDFSDKKRTEILVDKTNQEIKAVVEKNDEQDERISQIQVDLDGIALEVSKINPNDNLIPNLSGYMDNYCYWEWQDTPTIRYFKGLVYKKCMKYNTNFEIVDVQKSLSGKGLSFFNKGKAISYYGWIKPDSVYSFRCLRIDGEHNFDVIFVELDKEFKEIKRTVYTSNNREIETFTHQPTDQTNYIRLIIENQTATIDNRLIISDLMFNRGRPKEWQETAQEVKLWANSRITILDDEITSVVESVDMLDGELSEAWSEIKQLSDEISLKVSRDNIISSINMSPENIKIKANNISLEGIVTVDGNVKIFEDGSIEVNKGKFRGEIDTDENVRVGTYLGMPLMKPKNLLEMAKLITSGHGGISWGDSNEFEDRVASITTYKMWDDFGDRGYRTNISTRGGLFLSGSGIQLNVNSPNNYALTSAFFNENNIYIASHVDKPLDVLDGSITISSNNLTLVSTHSNIRLQSEKDVIVDAKDFRISVDKYAPRRLVFSDDGIVRWKN